VDLFENANRIPLFALVQHLARVDPNALIRFRQDPRLIFHASEVTKLEEAWIEGKRVFEIHTALLGVIGASSPLATFFSENVLGALSRDDETLLAFYDMLHQRLVELLVEADRRASPLRIARLDGEDTFTARARAASGTRSERNGFPREAILGLGRLVGVRPRTRDALVAALRVALPTYSIRVDDFIARDVSLTGEQRAVLGQHAFLGMSLLGGHVVRQTGLIRLSLGPVRKDDLPSLSPGGDVFNVLFDVVEESTAGLVDAELDVELARGDEPVVRLGDERTPLGAGALLGRADDAPPVCVRIPLAVDAGLTYGSAEDAAPVVGATSAASAASAANTGHREAQRALVALSAPTSTCQPSETSATNNTP
jgi:type VI secretion system protein ImpH